ncbi:Endonuclease III-like protein 1 [Polyplax serrata]|uniref:Endonuclease III homolog n=1 Tax=Polyplax serrata TaxID=468196 RepID=A0AAN8SAR5_POLSC
MSGKRAFRTCQKAVVAKKIKGSNTADKHFEADSIKGNNTIKDTDIEDLAQNDDIWRPVNWEKTLSNIKEMRETRNAPVDTMGCDKCVDYNTKPEIMRFQALVSLMLSSQTKDEVTFAAMDRLKTYKTGLSIESILEISEEALGQLIHPVGFWRRKAKYIKQTAELLKDKFSGDIPKTVELLCTLPGVGPKMAHICMKTAWGVVSGIGVDTHVHRISNRIGWVKTPTKTPEQTRIALESWIPRDLWEEVNNLLVGFGQQTCKPVKPLCDTCANQAICPYVQGKKGSKKN